MAKQYITVGEFIERLSEFDLDLPVVISDWQEQYQLPTAIEATKIKKCKGQFTPIKYEKDDLGRRLFSSAEFVVVGDYS